MSSGGKVTVMNIIRFKNRQTYDISMLTYKCLHNFHW